MSYIYNTPAQQHEMLRTIGVQSLDELFEQIPADLRHKGLLDLPPALTELELETHLQELARRNLTPTGRVCFLGGGAYDHYIPAVVDAIASRSEFYTAYTPYQAEASQGSLQAFYEFQTLMCQLTGMEVSNASMYEGGTSLTEAVFMALRGNPGRQGKVVVLGSVHPEYRQVLLTYLRQLSCELVVVPTPQGTADLEQVRQVVDEHTACLVLQQPNFFGCLEEARELVDIAHQTGALAIVSFDPISLGLLARPGDYGADIAVAEGQSLGIPLQFGGPYLGILTCKLEFVRKMPGRLIGETVDRHGQRCFVLNLQAREQHIRRDKATSNICTNQGLMALRAAVYLSALGPQGLREVAELSCRKAHYIAEQLAKIPGLELRFDRPFFREFTLRCRAGVGSVLKRAEAAGFDLGPELSRFAGLSTPTTALDDSLLVAVTEKRTRAEMDRLAAALSK